MVKETSNNFDKPNKENTQTDIERRKKIVIQTNANNRLEGISPAEEGSYAKELEEKWVNGEISSKQEKELLKIHNGLK